MKPSEKRPEGKTGNNPAGKRPVAKVSFSTVKRLLGYMLGGYKFSFAAVFVCIVISAIVGVAGNMFLKRLIDDYITPLLTSPDPVFDGLLRALLVMAGVYALGVVATLVYNRIMAVISQGVLKKVRDDMFSHMQMLSVQYFDSHSFGDIMSLYTNDTDALRQMISQSIPQAFSSIITIVAVTCGMLMLNVPLTALVFACVLLMLVVVRQIGGQSAKFFIRQQQSLGGLNGYIEEMVNGQKVVKVFCHEDAAKNEFGKRNSELCDVATAANTFANITMPVMGNIGNLQYVLIAIIGGAFAIGGVGGVTLGAIASFLTLSKSFSMPIGQISQQMNSIIMALAGAQRIFAMLDEKPEVDDGYVRLVNAKYEDDKLTECSGYTGLWAWRHEHQANNTVTYTELKGDVRFLHVDFGYTEDKIVLQNVSLYANPGQKIAFVGATGAGKTTITNLINRFYDVADGKIRFDEININKIRKSDLRRSMGMVLQDISLFTGTIRENIRYGKLEATDDDIVNAAKIANAHDFITRLPEGYDTVISGDGGSLSQGQRQLISIARAAVANPPVMILDEATSSIDTRTEAIVQKGMDQLMQGRTVFVIAHRLSTVQNAQAIMVMQQGNIIERGTHEDLIAEKGQYYHLYTGASAGKKFTL